MARSWERLQLSDDFLHPWHVLRLDAVIKVDFAWAVLARIIREHRALAQLSVLEAIEGAQLLIRIPLRIGVAHSASSVRSPLRRAYFLGRPPALRIFWMRDWICDCFLKSWREIQGTVFVG